MSGLIIDSFFAEQLQYQAAKEGLVRPCAPDLAAPRAAAVEKCLLSILLYGPAVYFAQDINLFVDSKVFRQLGICSLGDPDRHSFPLHREDTPGRGQIHDALSEARFFAPFVREFLAKDVRAFCRLLEGRVSFESLEPREQRAVVDALPELAIRMAAGMWDFRALLRDYPTQAVTLIHFAATPPFGRSRFIPHVLHVSNEPKMLLSESHERKLPVLSKIIRPPKRSSRTPHQRSDEVVTVLRLALQQRGLALPRIRTIEGLLCIMQDERAVALREMIAELASDLQDGNFDPVEGTLRKIDEATHSLRAISKARSRLRWTFLIPILGGVVESALGLIPSASIALSLGLTGGEFVLARKQRRHKWLGLFPQRL